MALTSAKVSDEAVAVQRVAEKLLDARKEMIDLLAHNSALSIDWGGDPKPAYIEEDAAENIAGLQCTRQQISNAIGSFAVIESMLVAGSHVGNLNLIARPTGQR